MTATLARPTFVRFQPHELTPAPRPLPPHCGVCGTFGPVDRLGLCCDCVRADLDLLTAAQNRREALARPSLLSVMPSGLAWLGGAALLCVPLFAIVPSVVAAVK
jgi:hypothetical protein